MATPIPQHPFRPRLSKKRRVLFLVLLLAVTIALFLVNRSFERKISTLYGHIENLSYSQRSRDYSFDKLYKGVKEEVLSLGKEVRHLSKDHTNESSYMMILKRSLEQYKKQAGTLERQVQELSKLRESDRLYAERTAKNQQEQLRYLIDQIVMEKKNIESELAELRILYSQNRLEVETLKKILEDYKASAQNVKKEEVYPIMELYDDMRALEVIASANPETKAPKIRERRSKRKAEFMVAPKTELTEVPSQKQGELMAVFKTELMEVPNDNKSLQAVPSTESKGNPTKSRERRTKKKGELMAVPKTESMEGPSDKKGELMAVPSEDLKRVTPVKEIQNQQASEEGHSASLIEMPTFTKTLVPVPDDVHAPPAVKHRRNNRRHRKGKNMTEENEVKTQLQEVETRKDVVLHLDEADIPQESSPTETKNTSSKVDNASNNSSIKQATKDTSGKKKLVQGKDLLSIMPSIFIQPNNEKEKDNKPANNTSQDAKEDLSNNQMTSQQQPEKISQSASVPKSTPPTPQDQHQQVICLLDSLVRTAEIMIETSTIKGIEIMEAAFDELGTLLESYPKEKPEVWKKLPRTTMWKYRLAKFNLEKLRDEMPAPEGKVDRKVKRHIRKYAYRISSRALVLKEIFESVV